MEPVTVGIVAAMPSEARALGVTVLPNQVQEIDDGVMLYICGVGPDNAARATRKLIEAGAASIVSWGTAGGMVANLASGTPLLSGTIIGTDAAYETDNTWTTRLRERLASSVSFDDAAIYSGGNLVAGETEKKELAAATGAIAVDMESGVIAQAATAAGVPFICIRVIADPLSCTLPSSLGKAIDEEGFVSIAGALKEMARRPAEIIPMMQVALHFRRATQILALISRLAGPRLLAP
ncbi:MAG: hypothetical protein OEQ74_05920 [Gammaproteobacteria bacterium]|nr:hypothetical protein [Gammaproteobacteria bacterium]